MLRLVTLVFLLFSNVALAPFAMASVAMVSKALVYKGPGSCTDGDCSGAAALMAELEGYEVSFIGPNTVDAKVFEGVDLYLQPGGKSSVLSKEMNEVLKNNIRQFVNGGGAYVGFCAGGFFAMEHIGQPRNFSGLALIKGEAFSYRELGEEVEAAMLPIFWFDQIRELYWEGGPYFPEEFLGEGVEVFGRYPDNKPASIRSHYGEGLVSVTALHPEAPESWRQYFRLQDQDGIDYELARDMIRWAVKK